MKVTADEKSLDELKTRLKFKYPMLTKRDLLITNNNQKSMLTMVAYKLRKSKEEMSKIVEDL